MNWRYVFKLVGGMLATWVTACFAMWAQAGHDYTSIPPAGYWLVNLGAAVWWAIAFIDATPKGKDPISTAAQAIDTVKDLQSLAGTVTGLFQNSPSLPAERGSGGEVNP